VKQPKFISGPPGTGKTSIFITQKYTELLKKYSYNKIIILSHTNVAADEIRDEILKLPEMQGVTKKAMKYKICTIHSYCKSRLVGRKEVLSYEDHKNLCTIETLFKLQTVNESEFNADKHKFYRYLADAHGRGHTIKEHWKVCDKEIYKPYSLNSIEEMVEHYIKYKKDNHVCDYADMIQEFIDKAIEPDIDALIVDEAQDSNVPQRKALDKMATNAKEYYFVGDADQTIFEFAGSDADYYHRLSRDAEQLDQGHRCGKTINTLCKRIIKPIWEYYGYERIWKPTDIVGNHYYLPSLNKKCSAMETLLDKIRNTNETFLFTYRGTPSDSWVKKFFKQHGIEFAHVGNTAHVPKKEIRCHKLWPKFVKGALLPLKQIKDFWQYMGSKVIVRGKGEETFEEWVDKEYNIDYLITNKYLKQNAKDELDFALIRKKTDSDRILYIKKILEKGFNLEGDVRVKYANIHTVKGLTFDNVIVDLTSTRIENYFTQLRLKYVAYSRGKFDCWTVASQGKYTLGAK
jgi:superfamily I DNA/RNA helicase